jgi:hypothetical protein
MCVVIVFKGADVVARNSLGPHLGCMYLTNTINSCIIDILFHVERMP